MKTTTSTALATILLLSCWLQIGFAFVAPTPTGLRVSRISTIPLRASLADDDGMADLDDEWLQFQEEQSTKQISLSDFAPDEAEQVQVVQEESSSDAMAAGFCFSVAVACLVAVYYSGEAPTLVAADSAYTIFTAANGM